MASEEGKFVIIVVVAVDEGKLFKLQGGHGAAVEGSAPEIGVVVGKENIERPPAVKIRQDDVHVPLDRVRGQFLVPPKAATSFAPGHEPHVECTCAGSMDPFLPHLLLRREDDLAPKCRGAQRNVSPCAADVGDDDRECRAVSGSEHEDEGDDLDG